MEADTILTCARLAVASMVVMSGAISGHGAVAVAIAVSLAPYVARQAENARYVEGMENAPTDDAETGARDEIQMPNVAHLKNFAYMESGSDPSSGVARNVLDLVDTASPFDIMREDPPSRQRWRGPPSKTIFSGEPIEQFSVFVTVSHPQAEGVEDKQSDEVRTVLFRARNNGKTVDASGSVNEKSTSIGFSRSPGQNPGQITLWGKHGGDEATIEMPMSSSVRTVYLLKAPGTLYIGYFDAFSNDAGENSVETHDAVYGQSLQPIMLNEGQRALGRIISVVLYTQNIRARLEDAKEGIRAHAMRENDLYVQAAKELRDARDALHRAKTQPRFSGVAERCRDVEDWSRFDPVSTTPECRRAVRESCLADPLQVGCECFKPDSDVYTDTTCEGQRLVYGVQPTQPEEIPDPPTAKPDPKPSEKFAKPPTLLQYLMPL